MINQFLLKTYIYKLLFSTLVIFFLVACSTKRDNFLSRNSHALRTRDNILYNGQLALDQGTVAIQSSTKDNFWNRLPVERMQFVDNDSPDGNPKNPDFEKAEEKASKAIQKHSMNIEGTERNYQIDEAYLLLGKARYYDQRFFPALEAFNYILYKYPTSSAIATAKIWREKTNMRLGNDKQVIKNIGELCTSAKLKPQVMANASALLAESYLNIEKKDSAIAKLKIAEANTKINIERTRYRYILGQLYEELGEKENAVQSYQSVIDMKRKAQRDYVIHAYTRLAALGGLQVGDSATVIAKFNKLLAASSRSSS